jgi:hypothetical protein
MNTKGDYDYERWKGLGRRKGESDYDHKARTGRLAGESDYDYEKRKVGGLLGTRMKRGPGRERWQRIKLLLLVSRTLSKEGHPRCTLHSLCSDSFLSAC